MKEIKTSDGYTFLIDNEDYEAVSKYRWRTVLIKGTPYIRRPDKPTPAVFLHRELMKPPKGFVVDHINGDTLDNRRSNLRICTYSQNSLNSIKVRCRTTSKFKGVCRGRNSNTWKVSIKVDGIVYRVGHYKDEIYAGLAYDVAAKCLVGDLVHRNLPDVTAPLWLTEKVCGHIKKKALEIIAEAEDIRELGRRHFLGVG